MQQAINFKHKLALVNQYWSPRIIAQMNDYHFKLVKIEGDFVWHSHAETDEVFIILAGSMQMHLRDEIIALKEGEMFVVKKGLEHKPFAERECSILLIEPAGTLNTGDAGGDMTVSEVAWI